MSQCKIVGQKPMKLEIRHLEYQGIGFNHGYTSLDLFLANRVPFRGSEVLFLDARGHVFNTGKTAANVGLGWRHLYHKAKRSIGGNIYYDYRQGNRKGYSQCSFGIEYLNPRWLLRTNGYVVIGSHSKQYDLKFSHFQDHNFYLSRKHEYAFSGVDAELGYHFKQIEDIDFYFGVIPYYFKGKVGSPALGGKLRFVARLTEYCKIELADSYDSTFRNRFNATLGFSIPFGSRTKEVKKNPKKEGKCPSQSWGLLQTWAYEAPLRNEIIPLKSKKSTDLAIDQSTGNPFLFYFVNNTSSSLGTYESPFPTLAQAETASGPGNVIYVFPGNGTTSGMDSGITLQNSQRFLGSGVSHDFQTTHGNVKIPAQTVNSPSITNGAGAVVTLALNNEVSGFVIQGGDPGISGNWMGGIASTLINRNVFNDSSGMSIYLVPNQAQVNLTVDSNEFFQPAQNGVLIEMADSTGVVALTNNSMNFMERGILEGSNAIEFNATGTTNATVRVSNNFISNPVLSGVHIHSIGDLVRSSIVRSEISNNVIWGRAKEPNDQASLIEIQTLNGSSSIASVYDNQLLCPEEQGIASIALFIDANTTSNSNSQIEIFNNHVVGGAGFSMITTAGGSGAGQAFIHHNTIFQANDSDFLPTGGAISFVLDGAGSIEALVEDNTIAEAGYVSGDAAAVSVVVTGLPDLIHVRCINNLFNLNSNGGILIESSSSALIEFEAIGNTFISPYLSIIDFFNKTNIGIQTAANQTLFAQIINNKMLEKGTQLGFLVRGEGTCCLKLEGNTFPNGAILDTANSVTGVINLEYPFQNNGSVNLDGKVNLVPPGRCNNN